MHGVDVQTSSPLALEWQLSGFHRNSLQNGMSGPGVTSLRPKSCLLTEEKKLLVQHSCLEWGLCSQSF